MESTQGGDRGKHRFNSSLYPDRNLTRQYEKKQQDLMFEYNRIGVLDHRYSKYKRLSEWIGESAAQHKLGLNQLSAATEYNAYAKQFRNAYKEYAKEILQYNKQAKDLNKYTPKHLHSKIIEDHIDIMNKAYNSIIGSNVNPFKRGVDGNIPDIESLQ